MKRGLTGKWVPRTVEGRDYDAFLPHELPPKKPSLEWSADLVNALTRAATSVSRLDGAARLLPNLHLFLYTYIRKEAVLSSQIEGTQSSLSDLLMHESEVVPGVALDDVAEVSSYVKAINDGVRRTRAGERLSVDLLLDLHKTLLSNGRGSSKDPGKIRVTQNWIGAKTPDRAIFVPPPPDQVHPALSSLIEYCNGSSDHILVKAALAHLQFETIHPFRDGNGRIGRLLITLLLCKDGLISEPLVYLSLFFKERRDEYYEQLQAVRISGDWEKWLKFFFLGVAEVTESAFALTGQIQQLFANDEKLIRDKAGRKARGMLEMYRALQQAPVLTISRAAEILDDTVSRPTLYAAASELAKMGLVSSVLNKQGIQLHIYNKYFDLISS
jgi:Fic family protein